MVNKQSDRRFFRICPICGTRYKTSLVNWIKRDGCHACAGERQRGINNPTAKPVFVFNAEGVFCQQFECERDAAKFLDISASSVGRRCKDHKPLTFGKYIGFTLWNLNDYQCQH